MRQLKAVGRPASLPAVWIHRISLPHALSSFEDGWQNRLCTLNLIDAKPDQSSDAFMTTNSAGYLVADFANRFIGGSTLENSAVQEETHFSEHPACTLATLLNEGMQDNEAIQIGGSLRHAATQGYNRSLKFSGRVQPTHPAPTITAMDAHDYIHREPKLNTQQAFIEQLKSTHINRDIGKATAAFTNTEYLKVATGNWGCGAFGGDPVIKLIIQLIAATLAGKQEIRYHSFGDPRINKAFCNKLTVRTDGLTAETSPLCVARSCSAAAATIIRFKRS